MVLPPRVALLAAGQERSGCAVLAAALLCRCQSVSTFRPAGLPALLCARPSRATESSAFHRHAHGRTLAGRVTPGATTSGPAQ